MLWGEDRMRKVTYLLHKFPMVKTDLLNIFSCNVTVYKDVSTMLNSDIVYMTVI